MNIAVSEAQFVSFFIQDQMYGIDINLVREVNPNINITKVPRSGPEVRGMVNIRGQIVMIIDLNVIFGREALAVNEDSQLLVLKTAQEVRRIPGYSAGFSLDMLGENPIAFLIDRVGDVVQAAQSDIEPPPPHMQEFKVGIIRLKGDLMIILNPGEVLKVE